MVEAQTQAPGHGQEHDAGEANGRTRTYVHIGLFVAVLTGVEVGLFYASQAGLRDSVARFGILVTMAIKLSVGAAWFMHLRSDHRVYRQIVVGGFLLSIVVLAVAIAIMLLSQVPDL